jgi:ABC-2 type transport system permease protein
MTALVQIRLLWWRKILESLRTPAWVVMGLTTPLLYLALFAPLLRQLTGGPGFEHGTALDVFLPGVLALMAFSAGTGAGWLVISERQTGVLERLQVAPLRRGALLLGQALRDIVTFLVPAAILIVAALPFGYHPEPGGILLTLPLLTLVVAATSACSVALGLTLGDIGALAAVVTGLQLPLILLSGILLPLSLAPLWLRALAHADPLYYVVEASRDLSSGAIATMAVALGYLVASALTAVTVSWAARAYRSCGC